MASPWVPLPVCTSVSPSCLCVAGTPTSPTSLRLCDEQSSSSPADRRYVIKKFSKLQWSVWYFLEMGCLWCLYYLHCQKKMKTMIDLRYALWCRFQIGKSQVQLHSPYSVYILWWRINPGKLTCGWLAHSDTLAHTHTRQHKCFIKKLCLWDCDIINLVQHLNNIDMLEFPFGKIFLV